MGSGSSKISRKASTVVGGIAGVEDVLPSSSLDGKGGKPSGKAAAVERLVHPGGEASMPNSTRQVANSSTAGNGNGAVKRVSVGGDGIYADGSSKVMITRQGSVNILQHSKFGSESSEKLGDMIDSGLSPAENAAELLKRILESNQALSEQNKAAIKFAQSVLILSPGAEAAVPAGLQAEEDDADDMEDEEVKRWLRADFTPLKREGKIKNKMKAVGLGLLAGKKLANITGREKIEKLAANLPYKVSDDEEKAIIELLDKGTDWDFDIFKLRELTGERELQTFAWHALMRWDLVRTFNIDPATLVHFLAWIEEMYTDTTYHNKTHAADVVQGVYWMLSTAKVETFLSDIEILSLLLGAMIHDVGHDGYNNNYHKNAASDRAIDANDTSIQENFHARTVFAMMRDRRDIDILSGCSAQQKQEIRRIIINVVLATDMSKHFVGVKDFQNLIQEKGSVPAEWSDSTDSLMSNVMHMCDISNPARPQRWAIEWTDRCLAEFFKQGELEKSMGLPVSPNCDYEKTSRPASQVGFIKFIVLPSFNVLGELLPAVKATCCKCLEENLAFWNQELEEEKKMKAMAGSFKGSMKSPAPAPADRAPSTNRTPSATGATTST